MIEMPVKVGLSIVSQNALKGFADICLAPKVAKVRAKYANRVKRPG